MSLNFGQDRDETEFLGPNFFALKFGLYFSMTELTERSKIEIEIFGPVKYPPLRTNISPPLLLLSGRRERKRGGWGRI